MKLSHYTRSPLTFNPTKTYTQSEHAYKPNGLWVSIDGEQDWPTFCRSEDFRVETLKHRTEFRLVPHANVLLLNTVALVNAFDFAFCDESDNRIDWATVARLFDGIIIAPYQWKLRRSLRMHWYYPWDCASGCIWNLSALEVVTKDA